MKTYNVSIIETLEKTVKIIATTEQEAREIAHTRYFDNKYNLDCTNLELYIREDKR